MSTLSSDSMPLRERLLRRLLFWLPKMCFLSQPLAPFLLASDDKTFPLQQMQAGLVLSKGLLWAFLRRGHQEQCTWLAQEGFAISFLQ